MTIQRMCQPQEAVQLDLDMCGKHTLIPPVHDDAALANGSTQCTGEKRHQTILLRVASEHPSSMRCSDET